MRKLRLRERNDCPRSQRQEAGDTGLEPGRWVSKSKSFAYNALSLTSRGAEKPREGVTEWKTDQRNHFLHCMRFEVRGQGARMLCGSQALLSNTGRFGVVENSNHRGCVLYVVINTNRHRTQEAGRQLLNRFQPSWLVCRVGC